MIVLPADAVALAAIEEELFEQVISAPGAQVTVGVVVFWFKVVEADAEQPLPAWVTVTEYAPAFVVENDDEVLPVDHAYESALPSHAVADAVIVRLVFVQVIGPSFVALTDGLQVSATTVAVARRVQLENERSETATVYVPGVLTVTVLVP